MKNKIAFLTLMLAVNFSFLNPAHCHLITNEICDPELEIETFETSIPQVDCDIFDGYRYISLGVGPFIVIPNVGIGYRKRCFEFGWDTAVSFSTIGYAHQVSAHVVGHYYLSPLQKNSAYLGLGLMGSGIWTNKREGGGTLSPDFVFGKELDRSCNSKHFIEMHVAIPSLWLSHKKHHHCLYFPLMYIKYGIAF